MDEPAVTAQHISMTTRQRYEAALREWTESVTSLHVALSSFMDDGLRTSDGLWILTMSQKKAETLRVARARADTAKAALDRIIDDLQMSHGMLPPK